MRISGRSWRIWRSTWSMYIMAKDGAAQLPIAIPVDFEWNWLCRRWTSSHRMTHWMDEKSLDPC
jgi:hypothetical protein